MYHLRGPVRLRCMTRHTKYRLAIAAASAAAGIALSAGQA
jgi:hypothetical protein